MEILGRLGIKIERICRNVCGLGQMNVTSNSSFNPLKPNDPYRGRTAPLTSKVAFYIHLFIYIYSTNIGTEYFKHGIYSPFFLLKMQFVS